MSATSERFTVTHVVPAFFGLEDRAFGGAERYVLELSRHMARIVPTKIVSFGKHAQHRQVDGVDVRILRNWCHFRRFKFDPINPFVLRYVSGSDIIHFHQTRNIMSSLVVLYAHLFGKRIFTTDLGGGGMALHKHVDITNWYAGHLHISEFSRRHFGHADLKSASVILGGVDTEKFRPDPQGARTGEVLYVGRLLPHKGINYLLEAVDARTPVTVIGRTHSLQYFELLQQRAEGKRVSFHHDFGDAQIIEAYQRALCIVLPSVYTTVFGAYKAIPELLGQTLLEGMACGTPAICTDVGSLPEVVEDGVSGFIVPPNDPAALRSRIEFLQQHPEQAQQMGQAARARVLAHFTWDATVRKCLRAYGCAELTRAESAPAQ